MSKPCISHDDHVVVIQYHKDGLKAKEIANRSGVALRTVYNLVKKYEASGGEGGLSHGYGGWRPRKVSALSLSVLKRQI